MHRHLVAVKVSVEGCTDQRMQLDGLALDQNGLECLDTEPVKRWSTVQQDGMLANNLLKNVPHLGTLALHKAFCRLDGRGITPQLQL